MRKQGKDLGFSLLGQKIITCQSFLYKTVLFENSEGGRTQNLVAGSDPKGASKNWKTSAKHVDSPKSAGGMGSGGGRKYPLPTSTPEHSTMVVRCCCVF